MGLWFIILLIVVGIAVLLTVVGALFFFDFAIRRKPARENVEPPPSAPGYGVWDKMEQGRRWIHGKAPEQVEITSYDGLRLNGYLLEAPEKTHKLIIMMHGFRSHDFNDFATSVRQFHELGFHVLLADQRAHGKSEGKYITYGIKERYDCRDWISFAENRYGKTAKIFLMGVSMGCATVLMTLGFKPRVRGVIADCGFTSPMAIFKHVMKTNYHLPPFPILYAAGLFCSRVAGFRLNEYSTLDALKGNTVPVLFIHGASDTFVPTGMSRENFAACTSPKELLIVPEAKHAMSILTAPDTCWEAMKQFVLKNL